MRRPRFLAPAPLALLGAAAVLSLGAASSSRPTLVTVPEIPASEYAARRERLAESLRADLGEGQRGVLVLRSVPVIEDWPTPNSPDFFYLTGLEDGGLGLILRIGKDKTQETLLLPPRDRAQEKWIGKRLSSGALEAESGEPDADRREAMKQTGFEDIDSIEALPKLLDKHLAGAAVLWTTVTEAGLAADPTREQLFADRIRGRFPSLRIADSKDNVARLRWVKSAGELARLQQAIDTTVESLRDAIGSVRTAGGEYELQGIIDGGFRRRGATAFAFPSIVGAGIHSTTLHYEANRGPVRDGDVVLMDVGASVGGYSADVTRTVPANGTFTARQREIYELVLRAQTEAAALIKPGALIGDVHAKAKEVIAAAGHEKDFLHGTSHWLGIEVHDVGDRTWPLEPGVVLTVEPGIYLPSEGFGVRIEDDYLVTAGGSRKLSGRLASDVATIEKLTREGAVVKH